MSKAYWVVRVSVRDAERYPEYLQAATPAFQKFGANFIVRGGPYEAMEGVARERNVVVEFADRATALACYHSPEYQRAKALRQKYAETDFINDWHTIGLEWTEGRAVWSVDGIPCKTVTADYVPKVPMYVILSNSVGSRQSPAGAPNEATVFPNDFAIDYIRIYQAPPPTQIVKAEPPAVKAPAPAPEAKPIIAILPASPLP